MMKQKKDIASCQEYRGLADMEAVEYKYPLKMAQKYVLRITLVASSVSIQPLFRWSQK